MFTFKMSVCALILVTSFSSMAQQAGVDATQVRIKSTGEVYNVTKSTHTAESKVQAGFEAFPILETDDKGESKADVPKFALERVFSTPNRIRVKLKVPLFKYDQAMSGARYENFVSINESRDPHTGIIKRTKEFQSIELAWCGAEHCLNESAYLVENCAKVGPKECQAPYETIIVDFSKIKALEPAEAEYFYISGYQKKIPGKDIGIFFYPYPGFVKAAYRVDVSKRMFGPDVYYVRYPTQREIDEENRIAGKLDDKALNEIQKAEELKKKTRYLHLPVNIGKSGTTVDGVNASGTSSSTEVKKTIKRYCMDGMGRPVGVETVVESNNISTTSSTSRSSTSSNSNYSYSNGVGGERVIESSGDQRSVENSVVSTACDNRKNKLLAQESLAGLKGVIKVPSFQDDVLVKDDEELLEE